MANIRTYTQHDKKVHKLVKAALSKKLMGVKIECWPKIPFQKQGWYLSDFHHCELFLGYDINEAEQRINRI